MGDGELELEHPIIAINIARRKRAQLSRSRHLLSDLYDDLNSRGSNCSGHVDNNVEQGRSEDPSCNPDSTVENRRLWDNVGDGKLC